MNFFDFLWKSIKRYEVAIIIVLGVVLAILPDPTDLLDGGTPIIEAIATIVLLLLTRRSK